MNLVNTSEEYTVLPSKETPVVTGFTVTAKSSFTPSGTEVNTGFTSEKYPVLPRLVTSLNTPSTDTASPTFSVKIGNKFACCSAVTPDIDKPVINLPT